MSLESALHGSLFPFSGQPVELIPLPAEASVLVPSEIVRVFTELIDNACKFSNGAPVRIEVQSSSEGRAVAVNIIDRGIGITPADEELLAVPLTRLNAQSQFPGFGLGLPIAKRIAAAAGATVHLSPNATGDGATATVRLGDV
jgi:signal transduction histidine kinase